MNKISEKRMYITDDYDIFKILEGNRDIKDNRVEKIMSSIATVGYVTSPIIVNEKMEIIDGQGRRTALERLGMPVEYIIHEGAGINECISLNINQGNWSLKDYISSYAKQGNDNYVWLLKLHKQYSKISLDDTAVLAYAKGRTMIGGNTVEKVKRGELVIGETDRKKVEWIVGYLSNYVDIVKKIGGRKFIFYTALIFCYNHATCDSERLYDLLKVRYREVPACHTVMMYLQYFEQIYNDNQRKANRVYLSHDYELDH